MFEQNEKLSAKAKVKRYLLSEEEKNHYVEIVSEKTHWDKDKTVLNMDEAESDFGTDYRQYVAYRFYRLKCRERNEFYTPRYSCAFNEFHKADENTVNELIDRESFYKKYSKYIKRKWALTKEISFDSFRELFDGATKVVYKSQYQDESSDVLIFSLENEADFLNVYKKICELPGGIVEEYLEQKKEMMDLYPNSVNTIKFAALMTDKTNLGISTEKAHIIYSALTIGSDGSVTDSIYKGGLAVGVDIKEGRTKTGGANIEGEFFKTHPDSSIMIKDFIIPFFDKALEIVLSAAEEVRGFYEWSIAVTEDGPELIGINAYPGPELLQLPYVSPARGKRARMNKYFDASMLPEMPYGNKISKISRKGIEYYWKKPEHADGYIIYRGYEKQGIYEEIAQINNRAVGNYTDSDFDKKHDEVFYRMRSYIEDEKGKMLVSPMTDPQRAIKRQELEISHKKLFMYSGTNRKLQVFYGWGNITKTKWSSSNESIATVDEKGNVFAVSTGMCDIICESRVLKKNIKCTVVVNREAPEPLGEVTSRYEFSKSEGCYVQKKSKLFKKAVIMMAGDMMCGKLQSDTQWTPEEGWNYNDSFEYVRRVTADSDFAVGNLETLLASGWPYMSDETYINNKNNCNSPSRYLDAVKYGGMDAVVMSNNHNCDGGTRALVQTIDQVDKYQLMRTGVFKNSTEKRYFIAKINGIKVGFLSYNSTKTGYNGKDSKWSRDEKDTMLNSFTEEKIIRDVGDIKKAGADYVIVYMHWGNKNFKKHTSTQTKEAQQAADAGADYIVGSNPHVLQSFDILTSSDGRKVPCAYSVGNFQSIMNQVEGNRDSVILKIVLKKRWGGNVILEENSFIPFYTYSEIEGCRWAPVPLVMKYDFGIKRINRKEYRDRIYKAMGNKIKSIGE